MTTGGGAVGGEIFVNIRTEGGTGGGVPGAGGAPRPAGGGAPPKDPGLSLLNDKQKEQLEKMREQKKQLKEYQDFQKLKSKESQNELINELQRARRQATLVAGAVTTGMLARNSKIMSTTMGALSTMFGAFIDIFLMPFIPLIIPVLKYIADLIPRWQEWTQKFADLWEKDPMEALRWAAEEFKKNVGDWGVKIGEFFGFSEEEVRKFYDDVGEWACDTWDNIKTAWTTGTSYIADLWERSGGDVGEAFKLAGRDAWGKIKEWACSAWQSFKEWQPEIAAKITSIWETIEEIWVAGGCTVMGAIRVAGEMAMNNIWTAFEEKFPELAANIQGAWCAASTYVKDAWEEGGRTLPGFLCIMATDAGHQIVEGLRWLWGDDGGGFRSKLMNMFVGLGDWLQEKLGTRLSLPKTAVTGNRGPEGIRLGNPFSEMGWKSNVTNPADMFTGGTSWFKNLVGSGGKDTRGYARSKYDEFMEENLSDAYTKRLALPGGGGGMSRAEIEREIKFVFQNESRYGVDPKTVEVTRKGNEVEIKLEVREGWTSEGIGDLLWFNGG